MTSAPVRDPLADHLLTPQNEDERRALRRSAEEK